MKQGSSINAVRAFTLIEVMLAVGIMAAIMVVINSVLFGALRVVDRTNDAVDSGRPVRLTADVLRRDLQCVMAPGKTLPRDFKVGDVSELNTGQPVAIEMYTATGVLRADEPWADIQKVTYAMQPSTDRSAAGNDLVRSVTRNLLCTSVPDTDDQHLLGGLQNVRFACYDGTQWVDAWDTANGNTNLPVAVRVRIQLVGASANEPLEWVVPLVSQCRTNLLQAASSGGSQS